MSCCAITMATLVVAIDFMFVFTAHLGLSCMNMIEGQDVYVKKMPHIGREV